MTKGITKLHCPKCQQGVLTLLIEIYLERFVPVDVLLCNLKRLNKPILKYGEASEKTIGIGYSFKCTTLDCSLEQFFDDEEDVDEYVRRLFDSDEKSLQTFTENDQKFVALIRREIMDYNERA